MKPPIPKYAILYCVLLCLRTFPSFSQTSYISYHKSIIVAEELFLKEDVNGSLKKYKEVLAQYTQPFAKDCFIALQLAAMQDDTSYANYFFEVCFMHGVSWNAIAMSGYVNRLFEHNPSLYKERVKQLYTTSRAEYYKTIDFKIRADVSTMLRKDDYYKTIPTEWKTRKERDTLFTKVLDDNINELVHISQKNGVPGEHRIGFVDDELDDRCDNIMDAQLRPVVSRIFFHHGCGYALLKKELMEAVVKGELHPREYALIYEWSYQQFTDHNNDPGKSDLFKLYTIKCPLAPQEKHYNLYIDHRLDYPDQAFVNKCRSEIGIATLEHDVRKRNYAQKHHLILFFGMFQEY